MFGVCYHSEGEVVVDKLSKF